MWLVIPPPPPRPDEVLVRVVACALNRLDVLQRYAPVIPVFRVPHIAGMDVFGVVDSTGGAEGEALVGQPVVLDPVVYCQECDQCLLGRTWYCRQLRTIGSTRDGGFAELVAVPARNCVLVDATALRPEQFAAIPVASVTAWHALVGIGELTAGETVVIPGAGSGVGSAGIVVAKQLGARVVTTVGSAAKIPAAKALGADVVIDRSAGDWWTAALAATDGLGADFVWDHVGGPFLQQAIDALRLDGRIVVSGTTASDRSEIVSTRLFHFGKRILGHGGYSPAELREVVARAQAGELVPVIDSTYDFDELPDAEARLESGEFSGKVVVCHR